MTTNFRVIPHLLHDAKLIDVDWDECLCRLSFVFDCLRRNEDGSVLTDLPVVLILENVTAVGAFYSPAQCEVRPSEVTFSDQLSAASLADLGDPPVEAVLSVNSEHGAFEMETASRIDWLLRPPLESDQTSLDIHVIFGPHSYAADSIQSGLFIRCAGIEPMAGGEQLSLDQWRRQFEAWWHGWEQHWNEKLEDEIESPSIEDAFIPVGDSPISDLFYRPPSKPAFMLSGADAPAELLRPVREYHEGHHSQDWSKMARVYPDFDLPLEERAEQLENRFLGDEFGRWIYVREVDRWWQEGLRACVVVRGIEHVMPDEEDPASSEETVVSYGLRKFGNDWIIATWSQGWPRHGSAPNASEATSWRKDWGLS